MAMAEDLGWLAQLAEAHPRATQADAAVIDRMVVWVRYGFLVSLLAVLSSAGRALVLGAPTRRHPRLTYPSGRA
jgi:hypothetical protein